MIRCMLPCNALKVMRLSVVEKVRGIHISRHSRLLSLFAC